MLLLPLIVLFIVVPIAELYVIIKVGEAIGVLPTIALLIADSIAGSLLMKSQGRSAWRRFQLALSEGRVPAREVLDGALVIFGGAFLLTPGFLTDVLGALLLLPPTRAVIRRVLARRFASGLLGGGARVVFGPGARAGAAGRRAPGARRPDDYDVEGSATEVDPPNRRLP